MKGMNLLTLIKDIEDSDYEEIVKEIEIFIKYYFNGIDEKRGNKILEAFDKTNHPNKDKPQTYIEKYEKYRYLEVFSKEDLETIYALIKMEFENIKNKANDDIFILFFNDSYCIDDNYHELAVIENAFQIQIGEKQDGEPIYSMFGLPNYNFQNIVEFLDNANMNIAYIYYNYAVTHGQTPKEFFNQFLYYRRQREDNFVSLMLRKNDFDFPADDTHPSYGPKKA